MKKLFAVPSFLNDSKAQKTNEFIEEFGTALRSENTSLSKTHQLVDRFTQQTDTKYPSATFRAAKYSRVVSKLQAQFPELTLSQLTHHAPALAQHCRPAPTEEAKAAAADIVKEAKLEAAELQQATQDVFSESLSARITAQKNAAGVLADAEKQGAAMLREAAAKVAALEAQITALGAQIARQKHVQSTFMEALHARSEYGFSAGGCTFHVNADALEAHPESYLALLVQADGHALRTQKTKTGAYKVDDLTAEQLQAVCHYLNTGIVVGCLQQHDTLTQSILQRVGSGSMANVLGATEAAQQLDPMEVTAHCIDDFQVHELALNLAKTLARELPSQCTAGQKMKVLIRPTLPFRLNDSGVMAVESMNPIFPKGQKTTIALQNAVIGTTSWLQKSGFDDPQFCAMADKSGYFEYLICTV